MGNPVTSWTMIEGAAAGDAGLREAFARRYAPVVEAYFAHRWGGGVLADRVADAAQDVFVECLQSALERADPDRSGGFRPYLYGITRNVARRYEKNAGRGRTGTLYDDLAADEPSLATAFEREWARALVRQARQQYMGELARTEDGARRADLLRLRVVEGKPIREIAADWGADADTLHRAYARARREFKRALLAVVSFHMPGAGADLVERECSRLLGILKSAS